MCICVRECCWFLGGFAWRWGCSRWDFCGVAMCLHQKCGDNGAGDRCWLLKKHKSPHKAIWKAVWKFPLNNSCTCINADTLFFFSHSLSHFLFILSFSSSLFWFLFHSFFSLVGALDSRTQQISFGSHLNTQNDFIPIDYGLWIQIHFIFLSRYQTFMIFVTLWTG